MLLAVLALSALATSPVKVALLPLEPGEGISEGTARSLTQALLGEARKQRGISVMSPDEISSLLSLERQKALLGCNDDSCVSELSASLGVDRVLAGSVSKLGASYLVFLKLLNTKTGSIASQSDRRLKDKGLDDVLDALPLMVNELFAGKGTVATVLPEAAPPPPVASSLKASAPGGEDAVYEFEGERPKLDLFTDGKGHYLALQPFRATDAPVFAGDKEKLYAQTVIGGGSSGDERFDFVFWDSRIPTPWMRSFEFNKEGGSTLQCGEKKISLSKVPPREAAAILKKAKLMKPRWRRAGHTLARDDDANYYFIDQRRDVRDDLVEPRLFVGPKGKVREVALNDVISERGALLALTPDGKLKISGGTAEWISSNGLSTPLTLVELTPDSAKLIYTQLAYKGQPLGTACDPYL